MAEPTKPPSGGDKERISRVLEVTVDRRTSANNDAELEVLQDPILGDMLEEIVAKVADNASVKAMAESDGKIKQDGSYFSDLYVYSIKRAGDGGKTPVGLVSNKGRYHAYYERKRKILRRALADLEKASSENRSAK